ncbi:MAG: O-antigen ligase family protein [Acholeplasma sp.]|nr:O-antigen ligase family protein [Acholeplasma sp.]
MIEYIKNNQMRVLIPFFAALSFLTWILKVPQIVNIGIYLAILAFLLIIRINPIIIIMFSLFALMGNYRVDDNSFIKHQLLYQIIFAVTMIVFIGYYVIKKPEISLGKLGLPMLSITVYSIISLIWTPDLVEGLSKIAIFLQGYLAYIVVLSTKKKVSFYDFSWALSLALLVLGLEYIVLSKDVFPDFIDKNHLYAFWSNPNLVAAIIGIAWVPSLYKYFSKERNNKVFYYLPLELIMVFSICSSNSRGLEFGLIMGIIFIIIILFIKNRKIDYALFNTGVLNFVIAMVAVILLKDKYPDLYNQVNKLSTSRLAIYDIAVNRISNPLIFLFGEGIGSSRPALVEAGYYNYYYHSWVFHNLASGGIIALGLTFLMIYYIYKIFEKNNTTFAFFASIGIIIFLFHSLLDIGYDYQFLAVYYYMIIAIIEKDNLSKERMDHLNEKEGIISN